MAPEITKDAPQVLVCYHATHNFENSQMAKAVKVAH